MAKKPRWQDEARRSRRRSRPDGPRSRTDEIDLAFVREKGPKPPIGKESVATQVPDGLCRQLQDLLDDVPEAAELRDALFVDFPNAEQRCMWLTTEDPSLGGQSPAELLQNCTPRNCRRVFNTLRPETVNEH